MNPLRRILPIGPYTPKHWMDTDSRGAWLVPVCLGVAVLAAWGPLCWAALRD